jgi:ornithine carbamoyltransferase
MPERDFLSLDDVSADELTELLDSAGKARAGTGKWSSKLDGKQVAMVFEKPSTRTRVSFEAAISTMGGHAIILRGDELQLGRGETIEDTGRVLSRYVDAIVVRTFGQERLEQLARAATVPVVNALSDYEHPCQCLADLQTIKDQLGGLAGVALAYLGDGNNVAHSLMLGGAKAGMDVRVACPPDHRPDRAVAERSSAIAAASGGRVTVTDVVAEAAVGARVLYTDVWASMGQEDETDARDDVFSRYQLNADVVDMAADDAIVMHCLPAHRGHEITEDVIDGPRSVVWDQAENRLHAQKALLAFLLT